MRSRVFAPIRAAVRLPAFSVFCPSENIRVPFCGRSSGETYVGFSARRRLRAERGIRFAPRKTVVRIAFAQ